MTVINSNDFKIDIDKDGRAYVEVGETKFEIPKERLFEEVEAVMKYTPKYQKMLTRTNFLSFMKSSGLEEWSKYKNLKAVFEDIYSKID